MSGDPPAWRPVGYVPLCDVVRRLAGSDDPAALERARTALHDRLVDGRVLALFVHEISMARLQEKPEFWRTALGRATMASGRVELQSHPLLHRMSQPLQPLLSAVPPPTQVFWVFISEKDLALALPTPNKDDSAAATDKPLPPLPPRPQWSGKPITAWANTVGRALRAQGRSSTEVEALAKTYFVNTDPNPVGADDRARHLAKRMIKRI